jgi:DNA-binding response OmpR family regulator
MSAPAPDRPAVVVIEDNLFLRAKIEGALAEAGYRPRVATAPDALRAALAEQPLLVLVNLAARAPWEALVALARESGAVPVVGYGPHTDEALLTRGRAAGCAEVVPNGLVAGNPAAVVARHGRAR